MFYRVPEKGVPKASGCKIQTYNSSLALQARCVKLLDGWQQQIKLQNSCLACKFDEWQPNKQHMIFGSHQQACNGLAHLRLKQTNN